MSKIGVLTEEVRTNILKDIYLFYKVGRHISKNPVSFQRMVYRNTSERLFREIVKEELLKFGFTKIYNHEESSKPIR